MQSGWFEIFFLAMLAGFIGLRLYHVLGRRTGHENSSSEKPVADAFRPAGADLGRPNKNARKEVEAPVSLDVPADIAPEVRPGLEDILRADRGFVAERFLAGAQGAYAMVLEAFWKGDEAALAELVSDEMLLNFRAALDARKTAGERVENRLIHVDRAQIVGAHMNGSMAEVTVRFDAEIVSVTRDAEGRVIAGDPASSVETHDLWTFSHHVGSNDPSWLLIATDEEE
ncbi:Tim44/TimA family putative adaptor protein [Sandaracinobacter sp. RS1-74]|uniref:Tim44/TimA family putative adaptor protein n=1 Tax=Sandaracinobacteroides sayramensis TaxID=2913411 RepID=UPI001EDA539B|nr:Tim44/TimA family putative adaptor protein [Sandaracinobacteroides sayramensis]MCG2841171.1 Tim44/TimA family putative adaptor protein [Sandaracinobacteroides sayramensis]